MAFEGYRLERREGRWCVLDPDTGEVESTWSSRPAAIERIAGLEPELLRRQAEARAARARDPEAQHRRAAKAAYREAATPGTLLNTLA
ncbi:MAG: hypothetical protein KGL36_10125, partial [Gammaproteobacteria bacterium]|nr:hypothetical protein [Gammaproteobacteria bacterium]